jgi:hypothetical protein
MFLLDISSQNRRFKMINICAKVAIKNMPKNVVTKLGYIFHTYKTLLLNLIFFCNNVMDAPDVPIELLTNETLSCPSLLQRQMALAFEKNPFKPLLLLL